jgi:hypothetical protein
MRGEVVMLGRLGRGCGAVTRAALALGLVAPVVLGLASCGGWGERSDFNPTVRLDRYRTYAWMRTEQGTAVDDLARSMVGQRVIATVDAELVRKGLRRVAADARPDFVVAARLASKERIDNYDWGYPGGSWSAYETPDVYGDRTKVVLIEFRDPHWQKTIWWGAVRGRFDPSARKQQVEQAVHRLMATYPPLPRG